MPAWNFSATTRRRDIHLTTQAARRRGRRQAGDDLEIDPEHVAEIYWGLVGEGGELPHGDADPDDPLQIAESLEEELQEQEEKEVQMEGDEGAAGSGAGSSADPQPVVPASQASDPQDGAGAAGAGADDPQSQDPDPMADISVEDGRIR